MKTQGLENARLPPPAGGGVEELVDGVKRFQFSVGLQERFLQPDEKAQRSFVCSRPSLLFL
jgi:hypothetical protein